MEEPAAYGKFGLANLLELREECLREFQFGDAYITIKQRSVFLQTKAGFSFYANQGRCFIIIIFIHF
jgi:hypothetical protein